MYDALVRRLARVTFPLWERLGLHVTPVHYYQPVPDTRTLPARLWDRRTSTPGVDFRDTEQLKLLDDLVVAHGSQANRLPLDPTGDPRDYHVRNGSLESVDGEILYCMIRHLRPARVIEIGSGCSTLLIAKALRENAAGGPAAEFTTIDPFPRKVIRGVVTRLVERRVQDVDLAEFDALRSGDVLFIDSSHVVATGSDVVHEVLEILPRLAKGVIVHIHDIFMPAEYRREWLFTNRFFWTEQYLVQAMLANNPTWVVLWGGSYMHLMHPERLRSAFRSYGDGAWPASLWIRKDR